MFTKNQIKDINTCNVRQEYPISTIGKLIFSPGANVFNSESPCIKQSKFTGRALTNITVGYK